MPKEKSRCSWVSQSPLYIDYHDKEWGRATKDDRRLFQDLVLDGAQAGLSWLTILKRRKNYQKAFANFNPNKVAKFTSDDVKRLMKDKGIIRNRLKIKSAINNAQRFLAVKKEFGSFYNYLKQFAPKKHQQYKPRATSPESDALSRDLKKRGFSFVGSTIIYAFMQATGMVFDHQPQCYLNKKSRR